MKHKFLLIYSWLVRSFLFFFPDIPVFMRFRGWLYGLGMKNCGNNFQVTHSVFLNSIDRMVVGDNVYIANFCSLIANGIIELGDNVLLGPGVTVSSGNHRYENGCLLKESNQKDIKIGHDCWLASNSTIVAGSYLPNSCILAANSVLTNKLDVLEDECIYGGIPARFIKKNK